MIATTSQEVADLVNANLQRQIDETTTEVERLKTVLAALTTAIEEAGRPFDRADQMVHRIASIARQAQANRSVIDKLEKSIQGAEQRLKHLLDQQRSWPNLTCPLSRLIVDQVMPGLEKKAAAIRTDGGHFDLRVDIEFDFDRGLEPNPARSQLIGMLKLLGFQVTDSRWSGTGGVYRLSLTFRCDI